MPSVTVKFMEPYIINNVRHQYYNDSVEMSDRMSVHAMGTFPDALIKDRRPGETQKIQKYREKIFEPITKPIWDKQYNALMKIRRANGFTIKFPDEVPPKIAKDETPEMYLTRTFPRHGSLSNWMFSICFKPYLIHANGCVLTIPISFDQNESEYIKPYPKIFETENVIDYQEGLYYILRDSVKVNYKSGELTRNDGERYWVVQNDTIQVFEWYKINNEIKEVLNIENPIGRCPITWMYGVNVKMNEYSMLNESRISGIVPKLNEAVREYSDMQAGVVQHMFPLMWFIQSQKCSNCKGVGNIPREGSAPIKCPTCKGKGTAPLDPYEYIEIAPGKATDNATPTPPGGIIERDVEIFRLQQERIQQHLYDALSAINMEFLAEVPQEQSGVAKTVDREELNTFVHSIAEDVVRIMDGVAKDCIDWRYSQIVDDTSALLPFISVPDEFDLVNGSVLVQELQELSTAKADASIVNAAQIELAVKKFQDEKVRNEVVLPLRLDPFAGVSQDELSTAKTFGAINQVDYIIHSNITRFIRRAMEEVKDFASMSYTEQMGVLESYADEMNIPEPEPLAPSPDNGLTR